MIAVPPHLLPALRDSAELGLELACDDVWSAAQRDRVIAAVHTMDALAAGTCTPAQLAELAQRAADELAEWPWPKSPRSADELAARVQQARELLALRDAASQEPQCGA
jgi:hypothetical protein